MKKNLFKTMIALCLTMVMFLSVGSSVLAAEWYEETGAVKFTNVENTTVTAYKVIDFQVDTDSKEPKDPAYTWSDNVMAWFGGDGSTYKSSYLDATVVPNGVSKTFMGLGNDSPAIKEFVGSLAKAIKASGSWASHASKSVVAGAEATFDGLTMGGYLFLVTDGVNVYRPIFSRVYPEYVASNWQLAGNKSHEYSVKCSVPGITKEIVDENDKQVKIGDVVEYKLEVTIPDYPHDAVSKLTQIVDELADGLTLDQMSVKFYLDATCSTEISDGLIKQALISKDGFTYTIDKHSQLLEELTDNKLYVKYSAIVDEEAYDNVLTNTAKLKYDNAPYDDVDDLKEVSASTTIYTYGINISKKLFAKDGVTPVAVNSTNIAGVQFELYDGSTAIKFVKDGTEPDGVYRIAKVGEVGSTTTLVVSTKEGSLGQLYLQGLDIGTYTLKEINAPAGYAVPTDTLQVQVYDSDINGKLDADDAKKTSVSGVNKRFDNVSFGTDNALKFNVNNYANEFNLPATGGMGTILFTSVGIFVMGAAVVMMVAVLKRGKAR